MKVIIFLFSLFFGVSMYAMDADLIIKKVENNLNGKTADITMSMIVHTKRSKRTINMQSLSIGNDKSFIKILYPKKDYGITFLKIDNKMWQYVPRIERIIKIPSSMMLQSWMGSDFSNDDLVKESSISDDYNSKLKDENKKDFIVELKPKEDAAVVWGRIVMNISKEYYLPVSVEYYDEDDILIRVLNYSDIKKFKDKFYPTYWELTPKTEDKKGHKTIMKIQSAAFDEDIDPSYFTKRALKRYSR
ncbi:MAG: outer membrane lipoprotein-sorting protein [Campylobacterota bacterium]|nr:outer membrane lipoprotein-sorting protein [Campylobacterota bacterium]